MRSTADSGVGISQRLTKVASHQSPMAGPIIVAAGALAIVSCLAVRDPSAPGFYPTCVFKALTGWDCPGCGSLRALHDLTHGDLRDGLDHNVLLVLAVPFLIWSWFSWAKRSWGNPGQARGGKPAPAGVIYALLGVVVAFWILRNIAGVPFLGSGIG